MRRGVVGHDHVAAFHRQAGQTFMDFHRYPVNRGLREPLGGLQHQCLAVSLKQVDRTDIAAHALCYQCHYIVEGFLQVV